MFRVAGRKQGEMDYILLHNRFKDRKQAETLIGIEKMEMENDDVEFIILSDEDICPICRGDLILAGVSERHVEQYKKGEVVESPVNNDVMHYFLKCDDCKEYLVDYNGLVVTKRFVVDRSIKESNMRVEIKTVDCDGYTYAWYRGNLWSLPQYTDGRVETDLACCCVVEESPARYREGMIEAMHLLGLDEKMIISVLNGIGFYDDGEGNAYV